MITLNVELWPFGYKNISKKLVTINLANVGHSKYDDTGSKCDYVWTIDEPSPLFGDPISAEGVIREYDRKASCIDLISKILEDYNTLDRQVLSGFYIEVAKGLRDKTIKNP